MRNSKKSVGYVGYVGYTRARVLAVTSPDVPAPREKCPAESCCIADRCSPDGGPPPMRLRMVWSMGTNGVVRFLNAEEVLFRRKLVGYATTKPDFLGSESYLSPITPTVALRVGIRSRITP